MWNYQRGSIENAAADALSNTVMGLAILAAIVAAAVIATVIWITIRELVAIYVRRGVQGTTASRILWIALATFIGLVLLGSFLLGSSLTASAGLAVLSFSFTVFVLTVLAVDLREMRHDPHRLNHAENLDTYLGAFSPSDGYHPEAVGVGRNGN